MRRLRKLAEDAAAIPTLERLNRLCLASPDLKFLASLVVFISSTECVQVLTDWSTDSVHAAGLERFSRAAWANPDLLTHIRPVTSAQRVEERFKPTEMRQQFPAALLAARRALPSDEVATWIQRLRLYLLIRMLDALEDGVVRERHLYQVSITVRDVCQTTDHPSHTWLASLAGQATRLDEFEAETIIKCREALRLAKAGASWQPQELLATKPDEGTNSERRLLAPSSKADQSAVRFFTSLLNILEHKAWSQMDSPRLPSGAISLPPYRVGASSLDWPDKIRRWLNDVAQDDINVGDLDLTGNQLTRQATNPNHSQSKRERLGTKVRLEHIEDVLFIPHSWHNMSPPEKAAYCQRIESELDAGSLKDRFGAACALLAQLTSASMHDIEVLSFSPVTSQACYLDLEQNRLVRASPRFERRWRAANQGDDAQWIRPLAQQWAFRLADKVVEILRSAKLLEPSAKNIREVWRGISGGQTLEHWFNSSFLNHDGLRRLSSPSPANLMGLEVFKNTSDIAFARLVASDARTALPAACAYGAYRGNEVHAGLGCYAKQGLATLVLPVEDIDINAAGSEVDLVVELVADAIRGLIDRLERSSQRGNWVEYHNLLTALMTLALLASSGARPVNSPFESLSWFDLQRCLMFVEDKVAGPSRGSRICVLSDVAKELLMECYLPHLHALSSALRDKLPDFANEIDRVAQGDPDAQLPLLFMLRNQPSLDWLEVSESQLDLVCQFGWPLQWNLFRHLNSSQLRRRGLHPDVRDALLGHAERDAEPHGDFSLRVPADDFEVARPYVNELQNELGFRTPVGSTPTMSGISFGHSPIVGNGRGFGRRIRKERRERNLQAAQVLASKEIQAYLGERTVDQLSGDQLDELARKMLFRAGGLPHAMASVRYAVFEQFIRDQWRNDGRQARLKRRYVIAQEGRAVFNEDALVAQAQLSAAAAEFEAMVAERPRREEGPVMAAALAAIDMILHSRICHFKAICALLTNQRKQIKLVRFQERFWFEWAFGADWYDGKPVYRVPITDRAARWIASVIGSGRTLSTTPELPSHLRPLADKVASGLNNLGNFIRQLIAWQNQVNAFHLPGLVAAYYGGRCESAGLPHLDWIRVVHAAAARQTDVTAEPASADAGETVMIEEAQHFFRTHHRPATKVEGSALVRCKKLVNDVSKVLSDSEGSRVTGKGEERQLLSNAKKCTAIAKLVANSGFGSGDAPFVLAHFVIHTLTRRPKRGSADRLRGTTALRYWLSLAEPFCSAIADKNLIGADEEDLTHWYTEVVHAWAVGGDQSQADGEPNLSDAPRRTLQQLVDFHDFMRDTYGAVDPDWSEVAPDLVVAVGRPGFVLHQEFEATLSLIIGDADTSDLPKDILQRAFTLIVCYRFGLRISEALGLERRDWIDTSGKVIIAVRSNLIRRLKTPSSRRQVPQMEQLTDLEQAIIEQVLNAWMQREGQHSKTPLLAGVSRKTIADVKAKISVDLLSNIKAVTRNPRSTVHMLRHAFAMRAASYLVDKPLDPSLHVSGDFCIETRRLLLSSDLLDRRALWAIARLLGHASPATTIRSYLNCLHFWLPDVMGSSKDSVANDYEIQRGRYLDLDAIPRDSAYLTGIVTAKVKASKPLTTANRFTQSLEFLRLILIGQSEIGATGNAKLSRQYTRFVGGAFARVGNRLAGGDERYAGFKLLGSIGPDRMAELISLVAGGNEDLLNSGSRIQDWLYTVGSSRQILLYQEDHFIAFRDFVNALGLNPADIAVVRQDAVRMDLRVFAERCDLTTFVHHKNELQLTKGRNLKKFQLDVARFGPRDFVATDRMVVVPRVGGQVRDTFELATLWLVWNLSAVSLEGPQIRLLDH